MEKMDKGKPDFIWEYKNEGLTTFAQYRQWITRSVIWQPPTDISEIEEGFHIMVEVAGMQDAAFTITLEGSLLVIQGHRSQPIERCAYHRMEIQNGDFVSVVELPTLVHSHGASANYQDGFLRVFLPRQVSDPD